MSAETIPSEVWWTQWLEAADAVIAVLTPPETAEAEPPLPVRRDGDGRVYENA